MASFLVDTSVWIDFLRGRLPPAVLEKLNEGIRLRFISITDIIRHEILVGAVHRKDFEELRRLFLPFPCLRILDSDLETFEQFAWELYQMGLLGKYTDLSIAFLCRKHRLPLLSFDAFFKKLSQRGIIETVLS